ncbi:hypothetical protein [Macrococcoides caseolyticum]|uniref:hypothetical protein n=1 Tax=Macrococcoides caseolyticum TaxID=69966 RepID=UPI001F2B7CBA|nr:hypothetical protein [Macrococcus caseolyticus]MCE4956229.1 hypothetical protein [Macrococcus caseolyticus]
MGLDMYIYIKDKETNEMIEFSYFRKFNALHGYFDLKYHLDNPCCVEITDEDIRHLMFKVNAIKENPNVAEKALPVYYGPFFGSYDYGFVYFEYIEQLYKDLKRLTKINRQQYEIYYKADY